MAEMSINLSATWLAVAVGLFCIKHYMADFVLQTSWMSRGKESENGWLAPLAAHAGIHALLTGAIFLVLSPSLFIVAMVADWLIHGAIDRGKAIASNHLGTKADAPAFWWLLGADQTAHQFTHLGFAILIAASA